MRPLTVKREEAGPEAINVKLPQVPLNTSIYGVNVANSVPVKLNLILTGVDFAL